MSAEFDQDDLISIFAAEAADGMAAMAKVLNQANGAFPIPLQMQEHFITAHRIRGAAALYGYEGIAAIFERLEAMCERAPQIASDVWPQVVGVMREMVQGGQALVTAIGVGAGEDRSTVDRCLAISEEWTSGGAASEALVVPILAPLTPVTEGAPHPDHELREPPPAVEYVRSEVTAVIGFLSGLYGGQMPAPTADSSRQPAANLGSKVDTNAMEPETAGDMDEGGLSEMPDAYFLPQLDQEVLSYFVPEVQQYLEALERDLLQLDKHPQNKDLIHSLFRTAHTLKGSAYTVGFQSIGDLVHHVEDFMGAVRDQRFHILPGHTDTILRSIDVVRVVMQMDSRTVGLARQRFKTALSELRRLRSGDAAEAPMTRVPSDALLSRVEPHAGLAKEQGGGGKGPEGKLGDEREVVRVSHARLEHLMNLVDELMIGRGRVEQRLLDLERLAEQVGVCKRRLVDAIESFADKHACTTEAAQSEQSSPTNPGVGDCVTLELGKFDDFKDLARRIGEVSMDMTKSMAQLTGSFRHAHDDMSQLQQLTRTMRDEIVRTRMVPIGTPFTRFRRAIREIARASNKEVALVTSGEHTEVDAGVVEQLVDPLIHLVRNAVYHGIELPADRLAKGKPATGTIYLHAAHRGNSILVEVKDDGGGLDLGKIREKAVALGLAPPEQIHKITDTEALQFIFVPGLSTADTIGDQAGRGVGLDVVKRVVEDMNGHIEVESLPDVGTRFTLFLPLTLLITTALLVRAGTERYAIALSNIREVKLATGASLMKTGNGLRLSLGENLIEVYSLRELLRGEFVGFDGILPVVIVQAAAGPMGLAVDELLGCHEIVIKGLGALRPLEESCFGGVTIDLQGQVILVIDPTRLGTGAADQPPAQTVGL